MNRKFVRIDCDNVGDKIELALYNNEPKVAQQISDDIKTNIAWFIQQITAAFNAEILLVGSDDILFTINYDLFNSKKLDSIRHEFSNRTSITISMGIGDSIRDSLTNLHIAKVSGKDKIVQNRYS